MRIDARLRMPFAGTVFGFELIECTREKRIVAVRKQVRLLNWVFAGRNFLRNSQVTKSSLIYQLADEMEETLLQKISPIIWIVGLLVILFLFYLFWTLDCSIVLAFYDTFFRNKHRLKNKTAWIIGASSVCSLAFMFTLFTNQCQSDQYLHLLTDQFQFSGNRRGDCLSTRQVTV